MDTYMTCCLEAILKNTLHIDKLSVQGKEFWEKTHKDAGTEKTLSAQAILNTQNPLQYNSVH